MEKDKNPLSQQSKKELFEPLLPFMAKHKIATLVINAVTHEGDLLFYAFTEPTSPVVIPRAALIDVLQASITLVERGKTEDLGEEHKGKIN